MRVAVLQEMINGYSRALKGDFGKQHGFWWDAIVHFQQSYDPSVTQFGNMLQHSFRSSVSKRLWKRDRVAPLDTLIQIGKANDELLRSAFEELFDSNQPIEHRISKFDLCCESLLELYKRQNPFAHESYHQQDAGMVSVYLSFRFPDRFALYHSDAYRRILQEAGSRNIPTHDDLPRFFTFCSTMLKLMVRDENLFTWHKMRLNPALKSFHEDALMPIVSDLMLWQTGLRF